MKYFLVYLQVSKLYSLHRGEDDCEL